MKRYTLLATAALSIVICLVFWCYDPLTPLTQDDTLVIVGFSAILVSTIGMLCRKVFVTRSAK
jgi:hypothetical protein